MKKKNVVAILIVALATTAFLLLTTAILKTKISQVFENSVIASLPQADSSDCYYSNGFQDYTDYCKYYYEKQDDIIKEIKNNEYFKPVANADIGELQSYFDNFEGWLKYVDYKDKYDFQRNIIDTKDFFYIENNETYEKYAVYPDKYAAYNVYFFLMYRPKHCFLFIATYSFLAFTWAEYMRSLKTFAILGASKPFGFSTYGITFLYQAKVIIFCVQAT